MRLIPGIKALIEWVSTYLSPRDKLVDRLYGDQVADELKAQGFIVRWSSESKLAGRLKREGFEVAYQLKGFKKYRLMIKDYPENQILIKKRAPQT